MVFQGKGCKTFLKNSIRLIQVIILICSLEPAMADSLQGQYKFPCVIDSKFQGDDKILSEIKYETARKFIKRYLQDASLTKLYTSLNCISDAISLDPEKAKYWVVLGQVHSQMAVHKVPMANANAIQAYEQALELDPTDTAVMILLGVKLIQTSQYEDALEYFETALKKTPYLTTYDTIQWMNVAYLAGSQTKQGTLFYEQMVKQNPELLYLYIFKAILHQTHFDFSQAQKDLLKVISNANTKKETKEIAQKLFQEIKTRKAKND